MPHDKAKLPNFFVVGAPKAGTTSLYHHLDQHPEIFMSPLKEPMYFSTEMRLDHFALESHTQARQHLENLRKYLEKPSLNYRIGGIVSEWTDYCRLFKDVQHERAIGEATTSYLWSKTAPAGIAEHIPDAKIIMVLRNPVERAFSQYLEMFNSGGTHFKFQKHLEAANAPDKRKKIGVLYPYLELGLYTEQVQRYRSFFPASQIKTYLYEDTKTPDFLATVFDFLEVDRSFKPDTSKRYLEQQVPRIPGLKMLLRHSEIKTTLRSVIPPAARPFLRRLAFRRRERVTMTHSERSILVEYYRYDVRELETVLGRDLSAWLR